MCAILEPTETRMKATRPIARRTGSSWTGPPSRITSGILAIVLVPCLAIFSTINRSVQCQAFVVVPNNLAASAPPKHSQNHHYHATTKISARWASRSSLYQSKDYTNSNSNSNSNSNDVDPGVRIEGLLSNEEFDRLVAVDETIRALRLQLPTILTKPLTPAMAEKVYSKDDFCFSVLVDDESSSSYEDSNNGGQNGSTGGGNANVDLDYFRDNGSKNSNDIVVLNSREELIALSDVLVLTTAVAQQAILVTGTTDTKVNIECQLIIDESCRVVRIPWRAKTPILGSSLSTSTATGKRFNNFEGVTDCYLCTNDGTDDYNGIGKVERFVVRKASFNGRTLNGPAIGQALKRIQSTVTNLQQNPILQNIVRTTQQDGNSNNKNNNRGPNIFNTIRDEFLGQAATALSVRLSSDDPEILTATSGSRTASSEQFSTVPVYQVESISELSLNIDHIWMDEASIKDQKNKTSRDSKREKITTPCPGTKDWEEYVDSTSCLLRFSNKVIPQLSDLNIVDSKLFAEDIAFKIEADESVLMTGRESLANFFQSMALTRKGTGISWEMDRYQVIDWKNRTVAISYKVKTNRFPLWTIQGRDIYVLDTTKSEGLPIIREIRQGKMIAKGPNGNEIRLDGRWLVEYLVTALQVDGTSSGTNLPRDFLTEFLMNQPNLSPLLQQQKSLSGTTSSIKSKRKISQSVATASYYIMTDLYEQGLSLFDMTSTTRRSPPAVEYMSENIELKGYLGESIVRGSSVYNRSIGSVIFGIRESIRQKRLLIEETSVPPRVELLVPTGGIRLTLTFLFRIPTPGAGIIPSPDSTSRVSGLPLKVELTSDYRVDPDTGLIVEHRLVETRINGQLTAGDQVSRWMQRFLNLDGALATDTNRNEDGALKVISDALSWFRSM